MPRHVITMAVRKTKLETYHGFPGVLQQCVGRTETVHMAHALHSIVVLQSMCFIQQWYNIVHIALLLHHVM